MNPRHRDRVAFVRVCSGRLTQGHAGRATRGSGTTLRLSRVYRFFGRDRETVPEAYRRRRRRPRQPGPLAIGDTLYAGRRVRVPADPAVPARALRHAAARPTCRHKRFDEAVRQLAEEGLLQVFMPTHGMRHPIVGVIGVAAVRRHRGAAWRRSTASRARPTGCRTWPRGGRRCRPASRWRLPTSGVLQAVDRLERPVLIFESDWVLKYTIEKNPDVLFAASA